MNCRDYLKRIEYLSEFDKTIFEIIFNSELPYLDLLYEQLSVARAANYNYISSYFLDFTVEASVALVPTLKSVPVSIDICPECELVLTNDGIVKSFQQTGTVHWLETHDCSENYFFPNNDDDYYGINLYFNNGIVRELEVVNWAGRPINFNRIVCDSKKWKRIFRYNDKSWFDIVKSK